MNTSTNESMLSNLATAGAVLIAVILNVAQIAQFFY
jgi:hypothetical protein